MAFVVTESMSTTNRRSRRWTYAYVCTYVCIYKQTHCIMYVCKASHLAPASPPLQGKCSRCSRCFALRLYVAASDCSKCEVLRFWFCGGDSKGAMKFAFIKDSGGHAHASLKRFYEFMIKKCGFSLLGTRSRHFGGICHIGQCRLAGAW